MCCSMTFCEEQYLKFQIRALSISEEKIEIGRNSFASRHNARRQTFSVYTSLLNPSHRLQ